MSWSLTLKAIPSKLGSGFSVCNLILTQLESRPQNKNGRRPQKKIRMEYDLKKNIGLAFVIHPHMIWYFSYWTKINFGHIQEMSKSISPKDDLCLNSYARGWEGGGGAFSCIGLHYRSPIQNWLYILKSCMLEKFHLDFEM